MATWRAAGTQVLDARMGDAGRVAGRAGRAQGAEVRAPRVPAGHPHCPRGPRKARLRQGGLPAAQPFMNALHAAGLLLMDAHHEAELPGIGKLSRAPGMSWTWW